jgi:hypothetical protein
MRRLFKILACSLFLNACGFIPPPVITPPTPTPTPPPVSSTVAVDLVACKSPFVDNYCDGPAGATFAVEIAPDVWRTYKGDGNGYVFASDAPNVPDSRITIAAPGYVTLGPIHIDINHNPPIASDLVATNARGTHNAWMLTPVAPPHVDPSGFSLQSLAAIRGAMWPQTLDACGNLSIGPRPGQTTNIIATVFITEYTPAEQNCLIQELKRRGYTHVVMGPLVDSDGYHGVWQPNDWRGSNFDRFLDAVQLFWDNGLAPVVFIHPDGWSLDQTKAELTQLLVQPRAQRLLRIVVPSGWEPAGYDWSSCTWAGYFSWARQNLPNALVLMHNAVKPDGSPYDAPVGTDALCDDNGKPNGEGWARVAPYLHGFLIQYDLFSGQPTPQSDPELARNFAGQYLPNGIGADVHGFRWHFVNGISGWPTFSAWGPNTPIYLYYGEGTAYGRFWQGMPESKGTAWGDYAIQSGTADGYLDGGTVAVPVK